MAKGQNQRTHRVKRVEIKLKPQKHISWNDSWTELIDMIR